MTITHNTTATKADEVGAEVNKDEWNAAHTIAARTITPADTELGRPAWTYRIEKSGANYIAIKHEGTQVSSNTAWEVVLQAVIDDRAAVDTPTVIELTEGEFSLTAVKTFNNLSNLTLRGQGTGVTKIILDSSIALSAGVPFEFTNNQTYTTHALDAMNEDDDIITTSTAANSSNANYPIGSWIKISSDDQAGSNSTRRNAIVQRVSENDNGSAGILNLYGIVGDDDLNTTPTVGRLLPCENLNFEDFTLKDERPFDASDEAGAMSLGLGFFCTFRNVEFVDCRRDGLQMTGCYECKMQDCTFNRMLQSDHDIATGEPAAETKLHYGVVMVSCQNCVVSNCVGQYSRHFVSIELLDAAQTNAFIGRSRNTVVSGCSFHDTTSHSIDAGHIGVLNTTVTGCTIVGALKASGAGISTRAPCNITGNTITNTEDGIVLFGDPTITGDRQSIISSNRIRVHDKVIHLFQAPKRVVIANNHCVTESSGNQNGAIHIDREGAASHAENIVITGNFLDTKNTSAGEGIVMNGAIGVLIANNLIKDFNRGILHFDSDTTSANLQICDNNFVNCSTNILDGSPGAVFPATALVYGNKDDADAVWELRDGSMDINGNDIADIGQLNLDDATILTIATAVITAVQSYHTIAAETGTTDTLSTINGDVAGDILVLKADAGDTITVDNAGNILLAGGTMALTANDTITLISDGTNWREMARSVNT